MTPIGALLLVGVESSWLVNKPITLLFISGLTQKLNEQLPTVGVMIPVLHFKSMLVSLASSCMVMTVSDMI